MFLLIAATLAACGGNEESAPSTPPAEPAATAEPPAPPAEEPAPPAEEPAPATTPPQDITVAIENGFGAQFPYVNAVMDGVKDKAKELGVEIVAELDGKFDPQTEAANVQNIIALQPDGVIMEPASGAQAPALIDDMTAAGIKVVATHGAGSTEQVLQFPDFVLPNLTAMAYVVERDAASNAAEIVAEAAPNGGKVGEVTVPPGAPESKPRDEAFTEKLAELGSQWEIVGRQSGEASPEGAEKACAGMLAANPDIVAFYVQADLMAAGCVKAVQAAGSDAKVVGMGGSGQGIDLIKSGDMYGTICYKPYDQGYLGMQALYDAIVAGPNAKTAQAIVIPTPGITAANLADCEPQYSN